MRTVHCLAVLLLACAKEPPPPVAAPAPPASMSVANVVAADAGAPLAAPIVTAPPHALADAGSGARWMAPGATAGGSSGFRAEPTTDGVDAGVIVGPRSTPGPIPTMDANRQAKPPPLNKHKASQPIYRPRPPQAADAGTPGPLAE